MLPYPIPPTGGGLYVIRLSDTHYYGGRAVCFATRWADHYRALVAGVHRNTHMQRVFTKHRTFIPEAVCVLGRDEQVDAEQSWLDAHHGKLGCVNISPFALGGCVEHPPDTRNKMSATRKSRPDLVGKARAALAKVRHLALAPEVVAKRASKTGLLLRGRKQTPASVAKRVAAHLGRKNTPETLKRMSESAKRRVATKPPSHGPSTRALISSQQRGRIWINDGVRNQRLFPSEAEPLLGEGWVRGRM